MHYSFLFDRIYPSNPILLMRSKKHTIKDCKTLLRSCVSMLDSLMYTNCSFVWLSKMYKYVVHLSLSSPESQLSEPWCYEQIVSLYNQINSEYLKY